MRRVTAFAGAQLPTPLLVRFAGWRNRPSTLVWQPAPPVTGEPAIARRLAAGVLLFDGRLLESKADLPWDLPPPDDVWQSALHGHGWLDHAAAASDNSEVWKRLASWVWAWLDRYAGGHGPGWAPALVARRLTRCIAHSGRLLRGQSAERSAQFFRALGAQAKYLEWRWRETPDGAERIEALTGLVYATLSFEGSGKASQIAIRALGQEASRIVPDGGALASRNPEELARILALLVWSARSIEDAEGTPATGHLVAIQRALPIVQALRHPSGALARFQGGRMGTGLPLDELLDRAGRRQPMADEHAMGYARLTQGKSVLIADASMPPSGPFTETAHASPLAFEFSHGPHEIIVNCGPGLAFGPKAGVDARRSRSHSTVEIGKRCSARIRPGPAESDPARFTFTGDVSARTTRGSDGAWLIGESTQYVSWFGLTLERRMHLSADGLRLSGEDTVLATRAETRAKVMAAFPDPDAPCPMLARFHLHPDVKATIALNGRAVALTLSDGSRWLMTSDADRLGLEPSRSYDQTRPNPRATSQIVVGSHILEYWGRAAWSMERLPNDSSPLKAALDGT